MKRFLTGISKEDIGSSNYQQILEAMQQYAEYYAKKCLKIAAKQATVSGGLDEGFQVEQNSILNIKLPNHE